MRFTYPYAYVTEVYDGDTIKVDIDLGLHVWTRNWRVRLARINAPELNTPEGKGALAYLLQAVKVGDQVHVESSQLDDYGRILGEVTTAIGINLSEYMVDGNQAVLYVK